jgi:hypothetical protein
VSIVVPPDGTPFVTGFPSVSTRIIYGQWVFTDGSGIDTPPTIDYVGAPYYNNAASATMFAKRQTATMASSVSDGTVGVWWAEVIVYNDPDLVGDVSIRITHPILPGASFIVAVPAGSTPLNVSNALAVSGSSGGLLVIAGPKGDKGDAGTGGTSYEVAYASDGVPYLTDGSPVDSTTLHAANKRLVTEAALAAAISGATTTIPTLVQPNHLRRWRVALARAQFVQTAIYVEGDSITAGCDSGEVVPVTDAQFLITRQRGYAAQLRMLLANNLGFGVGEGWVHFGFDDTRWTYSSVTPPRGQPGPVQQGVRLVAGNDATVAAQDFTNVDLIAYSGGATTHMPRIFADGVDITPSALSSTQKSGTVGTGNVVARGTNTTVTNTGTRSVTLTAIASGNVVADILAVPVVGGQTYVFTTAAKTAAGGTARNNQILFTWYDSTSTSIGSETAAWTSSSSGVGVYTQATSFATAPSNAVTCRFSIRSAAALNANETLEFFNFDMVPAVAINAANSTTQWMYRYSCNTVASGLHTLKVQTPVVNQSDVAGLILRKRTDAGVVVHQMGKSGSESGDHLGTIAGNTYTAGQQSCMMYSLFEMPQGVVPISLRIIALGTNEIGHNITTPAQYRANLKVLTDRTTAAGGCSLIVAASRFSETLAANLGATPTYPEEDYYAQAKDLANTDDHVAFIDLKESWGTSTQSNAMGFKNNAAGFGIHPTLAGHGDYARILNHALTRQIMVAIP